MNFQIAAVVGGAAFLLSLISGMLGGVSFVDLLLRAFFWAALGFGGSLGVEALLRAMVPELFVPVEEEPAAAVETKSERSVDIVLDEDTAPSQGSFIEDVDPDEPPVRPKRVIPEVAAEADAKAVEPSVSEEPGAMPEGDEEMPEIGSFLDAFKPNTPGETPESEAPVPEYGEYAPVEPERRSSGGGKSKETDLEAEDPVILAKAVQTVMKRDVQGT